MAETVEAFGKLDIDLFNQNILGFRDRIRKIRSSAPNIYEGAPNALYFLAFNGKHPDSRNRAVRKELASLIWEASQDLKIGTSFVPDRQFIPDGYAGRLLDLAPPAIGSEFLKGKKIVLGFEPAFKEISINLETAVKAAATKRDVEVTIVYQELSKSLADETVLAAFQNFRGNQKDALGSWSFLFSSDYGALGMFASEVSQDLRGITAASSAHERERLLQALHQKTIDDAYGIPFMFESTALLASDRIELRRINRFDLRLRFYVIVWR